MCEPFALFKPFIEIHYYTYTSVFYFLLYIFYVKYLKIKII